MEGCADRQTRLSAAVPVRRLTIQAAESAEADVEVLTPGRCN
jgi:hypothetical protein